MKRFAAALLVLLMLSPLLSFAEDMPQYVKVECGKGTWSLPVLMKNGVWYVKASSLIDMSGCDSIWKNGTYSIYSQNNEKLYETTDIFEAYAATYIPLQEASEKIGVRFYVGDKISADVFRTPAELYGEMDRIYKDFRFSIATVMEDPAWKILLPASHVYNVMLWVGDSNIIDAMTGTAEKERYREAMTNILHYDEDLTAFMSDIADLSGDVHKYAKILDSAQKLLKEDGKIVKYLQDNGVDPKILDVIIFEDDPTDHVDNFFQDWSKVLKAINFEHFLDVCAYYSVALDAEESMLIAMKRVFADSSNDAAREAAMTLFKKRFGGGEAQFFADVYGGTIWDIAANKLEDAGEKLLFGKSADPASLIAAGIDMVTGAGDKSNAVIMGTTYGNLQMDLQAYYKAHRNDTQPYAVYDLRAVTIMYLKAAYEFFELMEFDKSMENSVQEALSVISAELELFLSYSEDEYMPSFTNKPLINWLNNLDPQQGLGVVESEYGRYEIIDESMTWQEASEYCAARGGHLLTIESQEEMDFIAGKLTNAKSNCYWMGLYYDGEAGVWRGEDGTEAQYFNWAPNEPNNDSNGSGEGYVHLFGKRYTGGKGIKEIGQWNDVGNEGAGYANRFYALENFGLICEWDQEPDVAPSFIPEDAASFGGHYYKIYQQSGTWEYARDFCESLGGHLAVITTAEEDAFLYNFKQELGYGNVYFGLFRSDDDQEWHWVNGEAVGYTNWHRGEPNKEGGSEKYGMYYSGFADNTWNDGNFGRGTARDLRNNVPFVCEWNGENSALQVASADDAYRAYAAMLRNVIIWSNDLPATHYQIFDAEDDGIPEIVVYNAPGGDRVGYAAFSWLGAPVNVIQCSGKNYPYSALYIVDGKEAATALTGSHQTLERLVEGGAVTGGIRIGSEEDFITARCGSSSTKLAAEEAARWGTENEHILRAYAELLEDTVIMWAPMNTPATHYLCFDWEYDGIPELLLFGRDANDGRVGYDVYKYMDGVAERFTCAGRQQRIHSLAAYGSMLGYVESPYKAEEIYIDKDAIYLTMAGMQVGGYRIGSEYDVLRLLYGD